MKLILTITLDDNNFIIINKKLLQIPNIYLQTKTEEYDTNHIS